MKLLFFWNRPILTVLSVFTLMTVCGAVAQDTSPPPKENFLRQIWGSTAPPVPSYVDTNESLTDAIRRVFVSAPITLTLRQSHLNSGYVAQMTNTGMVPLKVTVRCNSDAKALTLDPNKQMEVGWFEGVPIRSKDTVTVTVEGETKFKSVSIEAP